MINRLKEKRRFIRHPISFPLSYKLARPPKSGRVIEGNSTTVNISKGGLLFSAKKPVGETSRIIIKMPFQDKIFTVRAKVVHCRKSRDTKLYNIGVAFDRFSDAFKVKLVEQIYLISEYRDLRSLQLGKEISLEDASREWIKRYSERFRRLYW